MASVDDHVRHLYRIVCQLSDLLADFGPHSDHLDGLHALSLLLAACTDPHAAASWRSDVRMRLIIDDMVLGLGPGYYKRGLRDLAVPDPGCGRQAPPGTAERWQTLVAELDRVRVALRPNVRPEDVEAMALACPGLHVISETHRHVGGAGGSQICAQRSLYAITRHDVEATLLANRLQQILQPRVDQRALMREVLEEGDDILERMAPFFEALTWPRTGQWIGRPAFDDWCRAAGVTPRQAESAVLDALGCTHTGNEGAGFAEIRRGCTKGHQNSGWTVNFHPDSGFTWEAASWTD